MDEESAHGKPHHHPFKPSHPSHTKCTSSQYPWGTVEVDNPRHSDFLAIRSALLHSHLADLKEITHDFLYENYRTEKLSKSVSGNDGVGGGAGGSSSYGAGGGVNEDGSLDPRVWLVRV